MGFHPFRVARYVRIPDEVWKSLLSVAFQAVTHLKGFSYCESDRADADGPVDAWAVRPLFAWRREPDGEAGPLEQFATNLNEEAARGRIDPLIGREVEILVEGYSKAAVKAARALVWKWLTAFLDSPSQIWVRL